VFVQSRVVPVDFRVPFEVVPRAFGLPAQRLELPESEAEPPTAGYASSLEDVLDSDTSQRYDLLIHVGVGLPGHVRIERRARRWCVRRFRKRALSRQGLSPASAGRDRSSRTFA